MAISENCRQSRGRIGIAPLPRRVREGGRRNRVLTMLPRKSNGMERRRGMDE